MEHKTCLICGAPLEADAHGICRICAEGIGRIIPLCLSETSRDPVAILEQLMALPLCPMHGPVHHVLVGAALLTACKNAGGDIDLETALPELCRRGGEVPGAVCGLWGACGAAISCGISLSILVGSGPLAGEVWRLPNRMTARALERIASHGGPRCCKRDSYLALQAATAFMAEQFGLQLERSEIRCSRSHLNRQCLGTACPFHAGREKPRSETERKFT